MNEVEVHLGPESYRSALCDDVRAGLTSSPKSLPPKYFYDARGSELFDEITRLPEYYPTRAETAILQRHATDIALAADSHTLVELGSGTSTKTQLLLTAMTETGALRRFVPFDVDPVVLAAAVETISSAHPGLQVAPVVGDFEHHLALLKSDDKQTIAFLGSTIGNLEPVARARFLAAISDAMKPGDTFLLGTDLVKDGVRLQQAYDDAAGVTAEFNKNMLAVLNRELHADFELESFEHVALWDTENEWIEMRLRSVVDQRVRIEDIDLTVEFAAGEEMRTEISAKFHRDGLTKELAAVGLEIVELWTDPAGDFALSLSRKTAI